MKPIHYIPSKQAILLIQNIWGELISFCFLGKFSGLIVIQSLIRIKKQCSLYVLMRLGAVRLEQCYQTRLVVSKELWAMVCKCQVRTEYCYRIAATSIADLKFIVSHAY